MNNSKSFRGCAVPGCENSTKTTPNKLFITVPRKKLIRTKWLKLARRDPKSISVKSSLYFCEDHFDLPNDMENYIMYLVMGSVSQVRMKPGCVPKKFDCQPDRKKRTLFANRPHILKKQSKELIEQCEKDLQEKLNASKQTEFRVTSGPSRQESDRLVEKFDFVEDEEIIINVDVPIPMNYDDDDEGRLHNHTEDKHANGNNIVFVGIHDNHRNDVTNTSVDIDDSNTGSNIEGNVTSSSYTYLHTEHNDVTNTSDDIDEDNTETNVDENVTSNSSNYLHTASRRQSNMNYKERYFKLKYENAKLERIHLLLKINNEKMRRQHEQSMHELEINILKQKTCVKLEHNCSD